MMDETEDLTPEDIDKLEEALNSYGSPKPDEKHSVHTFLYRISKSSDTLKTGNLTSDEVGNAELPVRSLKIFELMAEDLCEDETLSKFFKKEAEIITASSLSKDAKLINLSVMTNRNFQIKNTPSGVTNNKNWFKPKQRLDDYQV